ncbi:MAG: hypothetical protein AMXMBFR26_09770 [Porticoccaceae bacterium]
MLLMRFGKPAAMGEFDLAEGLTFKLEAVTAAVHGATADAVLQPQFRAAITQSGERNPGKDPLPEQIDQRGHIERGL